MGTPICSSGLLQIFASSGVDVKEKFPKLSITMFIMDWRGLSSDDPLIKELAVTDIKVVRSRPAEIFVEEGRPTVRFAAGYDVLCQSFDSVVLSLGLVPDIHDDTISQLAVPRDPWGILKEDHCSDRGVVPGRKLSGPQGHRALRGDGSSQLTAR